MMEYVALDVREKLHEKKTKGSTDNSVRGSYHSVDTLAKTQGTNTITNNAREFLYAGSLPSTNLIKAII